MLIGGDKNMGKTWLLEKMVAECQQQGEALSELELDEVSIAKVDFGSRRDLGEGTDTLSLVRLLRDGLYQPTHFAALTDEINRFTERGPASGVSPLNDLAERMRGKYGLAQLAMLSRSLNVRLEDLPGVNTPYEKAFRLADHLHRSRRLPELIVKLEQERDSVDWRQGLESLLRAAEPAPGSGRPDGVSPSVDRRAPLPADMGRSRATRRINDAFFKCLKALARDRWPVVLLFDSCEAAPDSARSWIRDQLLDRLRAGELEHVVVILAGHPPPDVSDLNLGGLVAERELDRFDKERVQLFFAAHEIEVEQTEIETVTRFSGGVPGVLAQMVDQVMADRDKKDPFFD
jgi:hypothetical protein